MAYQRTFALLLLMLLGAGVVYLMIYPPVGEDFEVPPPLTTEETIGYR